MKTVEIGNLLKSDNARENWKHQIDIQVYALCPS